MQAVITLQVMSHSGDVAISHAELGEIRRAKVRALHALSLEEKFELLVGNHIDFERGLVSAAVEFSVSGGRDVFDALGSYRRDANRRLMNLLATSRMYLDHLKHDIARAYGRASSQAKSVASVVAEQREAALGLRAMEAIRNVAQHRALPIYSLGIGHRVASRKPLRVKVVASPTVSLYELSADPRFDASLLDHLRKQADKKGRLDARPLVREHTAALFSIHKAMRGLLAEPLGDADTLLHAVHKRATEAFSGDAAGLCIGLRRPNGTLTEVDHLSLRWERDRNQLEAKNAYLDALASRFVSSEVPTDR